MTNGSTEISYETKKKKKKKNHSSVPLYSGATDFKKKKIMQYFIHFYSMELFKCTFYKESFSFGKKKNLRHLVVVTQKKPDTAFLNRYFGKRALGRH